MLKLNISNTLYLTLPVTNQSLVNSEGLYKGLFSETKLSVHKRVNTMLLQRTVANDIIL